MSTFNIPHMHTFTCMSVYTQVHGSTEAHTDRNTHVCRDMILTSFEIHMQRLAEMYMQRCTQPREG